MKTRSKSIFNLFTLSALLTSLLGSAIFVTPVYAAGLVVSGNGDTIADDGICTLREAMTNANSDSQVFASAGECAAGSGADTITFADNYTITLVGSELPHVLTQMTITGNGATNTIIQASTCNPVTLPGGCTPANYRVFLVNFVGGATGNLTLDSLTVRYGRPGIGNYSILTVTNSTISDNLAEDNSNFVRSGGGGIYTTLGTAIVTDSTFSGNSAIPWKINPNQELGNGGAILNDGGGS